MERSHYLCIVMGRLTERYPNITGPELRISLDQQLIKSNMPTLGKDDLELLDGIFSELVISVLSQGKNRKDRRMIVNG